MFKFLNSTPARVITLLLLAQAVLLYTTVRPEVVPSSEALAGFPKSLGTWRFMQEGIVDAESLAMLQADDLMNRFYRSNTGGHDASLFVAAYRSQRNGKAPHSPKNCLPGSGWIPLSSDQYTFDAGGSEPITVNRYIVTHGDERSLVLYWYQSRDRVVASEYKAKFWVMVDASRLHRTDTALVRVIVPVSNKDEQAATRVAEDFVRSIFVPLHHYLPA